MSLSAVPEGYSHVSPYLVTENAEAVVNFILKTFGAEDRGIMRTPDGQIGHSEFKIGDTVIMLSSGSPEYQPYQALVHVYVENSDEVFARALENGGTVQRPLETMFYGDRSGGVKDPGGNTWWISTRVEDVSAEEMERRMKAAQA